jgi:hypothetical protein
MDDVSNGKVNSLRQCKWIELGIYSHIVAVDSTEAKQ